MLIDRKCHWCTDVVALLPCTSSTKTETDCRGPRAALEQEHGEDDTEGQTKTGADEHRREAAVPLKVAVSYCTQACDSLSREFCGC